MPSYLADPVNEMFCIQEVVVVLSHVLADLVKEMFCFQEVVVVLSQVLADLVNGEFMQMQTKVSSTIDLPKWHSSMSAKYMTRFTYYF